MVRAFGRRLGQDHDHSRSGRGGDDLNGRAQIGPNDDVASEVSNAGTDATINFAPGDYTVTNLQPENGQTWILGDSVKFAPEGDDPVLNFGVSNFTSVGTLRVRDPNNLTTSTAGIRFDGTWYSHFDAVDISGTYHGAILDSVSRDSRENYFGDIRVSSHRADGLRVSGEVHDNHFGRVAVYGHTSSGNGVSWLTSGIDGGNTFDSVLCLGMGGNGWDWQSSGGEIEVWIDSMLMDDAGGHGMNVGGTEIDRVFIDSLWCSTSGNNGLNVSTGAGNTTSRFVIGQLYAWNNTNFGVLFANGIVEDWYVGHMELHDNDTNTSGSTNARFATTINDTYIASLRSKGGQGVDVTGTPSQFHVGREKVAGSMDYAGFTTVNGLGQEASGGTPTAADFRPGHVVEDTNNAGDAYLLLPGGTWTQIGT